MEEVAKKLKAAALEIEEVRMKLKAASVDVEEAAKKLKAIALDVKLTNICDLNDDVMLNILSFLDMQDKIAFALTCRRFRRISEDARVFRRVDLSRRPILGMERGAINEFFRNTQVAEQITELNISNIRVFNWLMDNQLEGFIMSICPHLEALHIVNCGMSLRRLHSILRKAPKLTSLSWSLWDITSEDIEFVLRSIESRSTQTSTTNSLLFTWNFVRSNVKSSDRICLKNIKHLHLEIYPSRPQVQILEYLVLSCCKDIEELEIYTWQVDKDYYTGHMIPVLADRTIPGFPQQSTFIADVLLPLHSLTVVFVGDISSYLSSPNVMYERELGYFISSVVEKKLRETKWRKFWILPPWYCSRIHLTVPHELQLIEEITAHADRLPHVMDGLKTLFQGIGDKSVRKLCLHRFMSEANIIRDLWQSISRVGGHALKFLSLSFDFLDEIDAETNIILHTLFSNCLNITELDLLHCHFEKDICEPLSKLRHLIKVQLMQCAISSKHSRNEAEISKANLLTFIENSQNITHFDVRGCPGFRKHFLLSICCLTDGHLLALAKLSNLESLTLCNIKDIREWTFLQNISENCKFLTTLRIEDTCFNNFHFPILMQSAKFLKHLSLHVRELDLKLEGFWNLLSHAQNLERLCIKTDCYYDGLINVRVAVETLKSLPRLQVLHLHSHYKGNVEVFHYQVERMLEEENSDRSSCFELVTEYSENSDRGYFELALEYPWNRSPEKRKKWQVFKKALPINKSELCDMMPVLFIPRF